MATIRDVAKYAGVSTATVSRVLNKKDVVSEETLQKVTEAVEKLSYHPNLLARSLVQGKNDTIGVLLPSFDHPYWGEMAQRLDQAAKKRGYYLLFTEYSGKEEEKRKAFEYLVTRKVGGYHCLLSAGKRSTGASPRRDTQGRDAASVFCLGD